MIEKAVHGGFYDARRRLQATAEPVYTVLFPGGAQLWSGRNKDAHYLAGFAQAYVEKNTFVNLDVVDEPNLIPVFNDLAAFVSQKSQLALNRNAYA